MKKKRLFVISHNKKKKEMVFECLFLCISLLFFIYLIIYAFNLIPAITASVNITAFAGAFVALFALIWQFHADLVIRTKKVFVSLEINATVHDHDVHIKASITNNGRKSLFPSITNLYIMEGIEDDLSKGVKSILFPTLEHTPTFDSFCDGYNFCALYKKCLEDQEMLYSDDNYIRFPSDISFPSPADSRFMDTIQIAYNLKKLTGNSIVYVEPNSTLTEDVIFRLPKSGYYRIVMVYTDREWKLCECRSIVFKIDD